MRPIHSTRLDKQRPVLVLTRELVRPHLTNVTVAPMTTTVRGLSSELARRPANGLDGRGVVSLDNIVTIPTSTLGPQVGYLLDTQEADLSIAIHAAFDID